MCVGVGVGVGACMCDLCVFLFRVTLEELYSGGLKHVEYKRKVLCKPCNG